MSASSSSKISAQPAIDSNVDTSAPSQQTTPGGVSGSTFQPSSADQSGSSAAQAPTHTSQASATNISVGRGTLGEYLGVDPSSLGWLRGHTTVMPSSISCASTTITGGGTDSCTVTMNGVTRSAITVTLSSSNSSVTVPASVTVAQNAASATFTANVVSVSTTQSATVKAATLTGSTTLQLQLDAAVPTLSVNTTKVSFGNVVVGQTASQSVTLSSTGTAPVTISGVSIAGSLFTAPGFTAPVTINPGQTATLALQFYSSNVSSFTGILTIASNSSQGNIVVNMSAGGVAAPALSAISCTNSSMSAAGSDACTVALTAAASSGGTTVALKSNNAAVAVPASVTVPANATSAGFTATASAVSSSQTATITATAGGASGTFALQLSPTGTAVLNINATSISFGGVVISAPATQSVTLSSTGTLAVTVSSATVTGSGFTASGANFPLTLNPGQAATLSVQFDPTATGAATGQLTITSNSSTNGTAAISLSGTGDPHEVDLTWSAPTGSSDPVSGYHIYRASQGSSSYQLLNSTLNTQTSYMDTTGLSGAAYQYYVTSVDSKGVESVPSNTASVTLP